jgi:hypothetical protein
LINELISHEASSRAATSILYAALACAYYTRTLVYA